MAKLVIPHIFTPGTPAQASQMNANFDAISNWSLSGQIETDSIKFPLESRSNDNQNNTRPILKFVQTIDEKILELQNAEGSSSIYISQTEELNASTGIIHINDQIAQTESASAAIKLVLSSVATAPAILVSHGTETLSLTKSEFKILNNTFKVNATQMLIPRVTTGNRPANAEQGSVVFNTTTKQLDEKKAASGGWAPVGAPVGSVMMWPTATAPEGWLLCNGDAIANGVGTTQSVTADFSALYAVVGANVPNFVGLYPRGSQMGGVTSQVVSDGGNETYTASAVNTKQRDATALNGIAAQTSNAINTANTNPYNLSHNHPVYSDDNAGLATVGGDVFGNDDIDREMQIDPSSDGNNSQFITGDVALDHRHTITSTDTETRPATFSIGFIIKY